MPKAEPVELIFERESETKNKVRFQEMEPIGDKTSRTPGPVAKDKAVVEKLYVSKKTISKMGNPETLRVRIEAP